MKTKILTLFGLSMALLSIVLVSAFIIDEWTNQTVLQVGNDSFTVSHHNYANSQTNESYKEFVLKSVFDFNTVHTMKFRDDGKFLIDDKAICFKDGTASDGTNCPRVLVNPELSTRSLSNPIQCKRDGTTRCTVQVEPLAE